MAIQTLERPGVQVIQQFQATSPTILQPLLAASIVGPAFQIVEGVDDTGALNTDAQVTTPALLSSSWYSTPFDPGVASLTLILSVNNGVNSTVSFAAGVDTVTKAVSAINAAAIAGLIAEVETSGTSQRLVLRTLGTGDNARIVVVGGTGLAALGFAAGQDSVGTSGYLSARKLAITPADYPDPRGNIDEVAVDYDTVRVFLSTGVGTFFEPLRTESYLQGGLGTNMVVVDDGDGDNLSPFLSFPDANFGVAAAKVAGTVDLTSLTYGAAGSFDPAVDLVVSVDGVISTVNLGTGLADAPALIAALTAGITGGTASLNASNQLVVTSDTTGLTSSVVVADATASSASAILGLTPVQAGYGEPHVANIVGTSDLSSLTYATQVHDRVLGISFNGGPVQSITMPNTIASAADIVTAINARFTSTVASLEHVYLLQLTAPDSFGGVESSIMIDPVLSDATLLSVLGIDGVGGVHSIVEGGGFAPLPGDELWVDGKRVGVITQVNAATATTSAQLKVGTEQLLSFTGGYWFIMAKGLDNSPVSADRPSSNLLVDSETGTVTVKHHLFRQGVDPLNSPAVAAYMGYNALRLDVSSAADSANVQRFGSTTDLDAAMAPLDTQNPLGLGLYLALLNAPGVEVTGLGIDEVNDSAPDGTTDAYARAFELLESKDVYGIAPLTHSMDVGQILEAHVDTMSLEGLERIAVLNPSKPTRATDTLVASTATANVSGGGSSTVSTDLSTLPSLMAALDVAATGLTEDDEVFVEFEGDANKYLVLSVAGGVITLNPGPLSTENTFFYDAGGASVFASAIVDRPMSFAIRGAALANRTEEAVAYSDIGRGFQNRRVICTAPDKAVVSIDGLDTVVEGYYLAAGLVGKMSAASPSQPFTEDSIAGFKRVIGAEDYFGETQLKILCGGGLWVFQRNTDSGPVITRHQLTTDLSDLKKREASIVRAVDATAKYFRGALRNFIGRFNITQTLLDSLSTVTDGIASFLVRQNVMASIEVVAIRQSVSDPDQVEIDVNLGPYYPTNKIRVTLVI